MKQFLKTLLLSLFMGSVFAAQQPVNIGAAANDGTGDPARVAFTKLNANDTEEYNLIAQLSSETNNVVAYGALCDGSTDDTAAIQAAVNAAGTGSTTKTVFFPPGICVTGPISIHANGVHLMGAGIYATKILFVPTGNQGTPGANIADPGTAFEFGRDGGVTTILYNASIENMLISTTNTANTKSAIRLVETGGMVIRDVLIDGFYGNDSTGLRTMGHERLTVDTVEIRATVPIRISRAVTPIGGVAYSGDHFNFRNMTLRAPHDTDTAGWFPTALKNANVVVDDAVFLSNFGFEGYQAWVGGQFGLYWKNPGDSNSISYNLYFKNIRKEQSNNTDAVTGRWGFYIDFAASIGSIPRNVLFENNTVVGTTTDSCFYLRNVQQATFIANHCPANSLAGSNPVVMNVDNVYQIDWLGMYSDANSRITLGSSVGSLRNGVFRNGYTIPISGSWIYSASDVAGGTNSTLAFPGVNSIDASAPMAAILAGGRLGGSSTRTVEVGTSERNEIGANASYVAGTAAVATIAGGYDNRNDQLAGTISGGAHHVLNYLGTHGTIAGGSHNHILAASDYSAIGGGTANEMGATAQADYGTISGGSTNKIYGGNNKTIGGGITNSISSTGAGASDTIGGGSSNAISGTADRSTIAGGSLNTVTNSVGGAIGGGTGNTASADYGTITGGSGNTASATYAMAQGLNVTASATFARGFGDGAQAYIPGGDHATVRRFSVNGDTQRITFNVAKNSTDAATLIDMSVNGSSTYPNMPDNTVWTGIAYVDATQDSASTNVGSWAIPFTIKRLADVETVVVGGSISDYEYVGQATLVAGVATVSLPAVAAGSNIFLTSQVDGGTPGFLRVSTRTAGTSFTITSSSIIDTSTVSYRMQGTSRQWVDNIGVAAVPIIAMGSTGNFFIRVQGKASTNIRWAARVDLISVARGP